LGNRERFGEAPKRDQTLDQRLKFAVPVKGIVSWDVTTLASKIISVRLAVGMAESPKMLPSEKSKLRWRVMDLRGLNDVILSTEPGATPIFTCAGAAPS
jgi:hypothetical protein